MKAFVFKTCRCRTENPDISKTVHFIKVLYYVSPAEWKCTLQQNKMPKSTLSFPGARTTAVLPTMPR